MPCLSGLSLVLFLVAMSHAANVTNLAVDSSTPPKQEPPPTDAPPKPTPEEVKQAQITFKLAEGSPMMTKTFSGLANATSIHLGSKCSNDQDCLSLNSKCSIDDMCVCSVGYTPSKHNLDTCFKVPKDLGDACEEEVQCESIIPNSECKDSKCICPLNYVYRQNRCWEKQVLGGLCNNTEQCGDITFAVCAQGVCTCESPLVASPLNKCLAPAGTQYNAQCVEDIQCSFSYGDEGHCRNDHCVCTSNHHYNGTKCITDKKLGEACLVDEDCAVSNVNNTPDSRMCLRNACVCAIGFTALPGETTCTKSSGEELAVSLTWVLCIVLAKYYLV